MKELLKGFLLSVALYHLTQRIESFFVDPLNESYQAVLSCGAGYCAIQGGSNF